MVSKNEYGSGRDAMRLEFILRVWGSWINTYNFKEIDSFNSYEKQRLERKYNIKLFPHIISGRMFKYDTTAGENSVCLSVYCGNYSERENTIEWEVIYTASCRPDTPFIQEKGDNDILYWYNFFGTYYHYEDFDPKRIADFELTPRSMSRIRKIFPCELYDNPVYFFLKHKSMKDKQLRYFPPEIFEGIPYPKISKNVGKACDSRKNDNQMIHYAWQSEITIRGIPFLDVVVISGFVENGIMDIAKKHRFFLTEDYVFSPDGGDFGVFAEQYFYGRVFTTRLQRTPNHLMLNRYSGKYFYKYMFSKYFIPAFELLAKAGYSFLADQILEAYSINAERNHYRLNYYGKNDKEIFGFKFKYLNSISDETFLRYSEQNDIITLFRDIKNIVAIDTSLLKEPVDDNLFAFISSYYCMPNVHKAVEYLKSIGTDKQSLYQDYLRLCQEAGRFADGQGRYPTDLKLAHDSMITYLNQLKEAKNNQAFDESVSSEEYTKYIFIPEEEFYCILAPRYAKDLVYESYRLSHCVRTYIRDVAVKRTKIFFLREQDAKSKPLVTIEVRGDSIVQARGKYNRQITNFEKAFITKWADAKGLNYNVRYYW